MGRSMIPNNTNTSKYGKDVGININARPNALNVRAQQPSLHPFDAWEYDDPNRVAVPYLRLKAPWKLDIGELEVGEIKLKDLSTSLKNDLEETRLIAEDNQSKIANTDGNLLMQAESISLVAGDVEAANSRIDLNSDSIGLKVSAVDNTGTPIVGSAITMDSTGTVITNTVQSLDFDTGVNGWQITQDGDAEFNKIVVRTSSDIADIGSIVIPAKDGTMYTGTTSLDTLVYNITQLSEYTRTTTVYAGATTRSRVTNVLASGTINYTWGGNTYTNIPIKAISITSFYDAATYPTGAEYTIIFIFESVEEAGSSITFFDYSTTFTSISDYTLGSVPQLTAGLEASFPGTIIGNTSGGNLGYRGTVVGTPSSVYSGSLYSSLLSFHQDIHYTSKVGANKDLYYWRPGVTRIDGSVPLPMVGFRSKSLNLGSDGDYVGQFELYTGVSLIECTTDAGESFYTFRVSNDGGNTWSAYSMTSFTYTLLI
jgi:hypothetical protein